MSTNDTSLAADGLVSGIALVLSGLLPWVRSGAGSSLRGMELAAALRSSAGLPDWAPRAAIGIVAVAVLGLAHLGSSLSSSIVARRFRFLTGVAVLAVLTWVASRVSLTNWGGGLLAALLGALVAVAAGTFHELRLVLLERSGRDR